jgi:carnitine O-acetyltransferase
MSRFYSNPGPARTLAHQVSLPKLPIPPLEDTCRRYLKALEGLQDETEHEITKRAVNEFLRDGGPQIQEKLKVWAECRDRYVHRCLETVI